MKIREIHLWVGLVASILIFLEAISGLLLLHTNWLKYNTKVTNYSIHYHTDDVNVVQAVQRATQSGQFDIDKVRLIMNHTLGDGHHGKAGNYKVRLRDADQALFVLDTKGNLIRKEVNIINNTIRDFHYGELEGYDLSLLLDIVAISISFLTLTGIYLGIRDLTHHKNKKQFSQGQKND